MGAVGGTLASQLSNVEMGEALVCLPPHRLPGDAGWTAARDIRGWPSPLELKRKLRRTARCCVELILPKGEGLLRDPGLSETQAYLSPGLCPHL